MSTTPPAGPEPGHAVPLRADVRAALAFQEYGPGPRLAGVRLDPLRKHRSENGWFAELFRLEAGRVAGAEEAAMREIRQLSASRAEPGRINAFHLHPKVPQNEAWTVIQGALLVWLVDCREDSPTSGERQRVLLSGEAPARLVIPAGVAHGYRAGPLGAILVYAMDRRFDRDDPNEGRLPWDHFGADLWEEDRG